MTNPIEKGTPTSSDVSGFSISSRKTLVRKILNNMESRAANRTHGSILLAGDPGVGKTTFAKLFSQLLGISLITLEAPHISEEQIIDIPFLVFDPIRGLQTRGKSSYDDNTKEFVQRDTKNSRVVLADSDLYSKIIKYGKKGSSDTLYLEGLLGNRTQKLVRALFAEFGGKLDRDLDKCVIPDQFKAIRDRFKVILFLDEFFRQSDPRIRNMLRTILNERIGLQKLPQHCYVLYASNLVDRNGNLDIRENDHFEKTIIMQAPTQEEWFSYLDSKYDENGEIAIKLKDNIVDKFKSVVTTDVLRKKVDSGLRISPRRWEQLVLYVNQSLPLEDIYGTNGDVLMTKEQQAKNLLANVSTNFKNYIDGSYDEELKNQTLDAICDILEEKYKISLRTDNGKTKTYDMTQPEDWRQIVEHQLLVKMKTGDARKYIPVISGMPGVGKTSHFERIALDLNLVYVPIDVGSLNHEDVTGIAHTKDKQNKREVLPTHSDEERQAIEDYNDTPDITFSRPKLFIQINKIMDESYDDKFKGMKNRFNADGTKFTEEQIEELKQKFKEQDYQYIIFFDELSRADEQTFNALRRIILEKTFGDLDFEEERPERENGESEAAYQDRLNEFSVKFEKHKKACEALALPKKSLVVAALNPEGSGTEQLTQHLTDVVDIIDCAPKWEYQYNYMEEKTSKFEEGVLLKGLSRSWLNSISGVAEQCSVKEGSSINMFKYNNALGAIYISPRTYSDLYMSGLSELNSMLKSFDFSKISRDSSDGDYVERCKQELYECFKDLFLESFTLAYRLNDQNPEDDSSLLNAINDKFEDFCSKVFYEAKETKSFASIASNFIAKLESGTERDHLYKNSDIHHYFSQRGQDPEAVNKDAQSFMYSFFKDKLDTHLMADSVDKYVYNGYDLVRTQGKASIYSVFCHELMRAAQGSFKADNVSTSSNEPDASENGYTNIAPALETGIYYGSSDIVEKHHNIHEIEDETKREDSKDKIIKFSNDLLEVSKGYRRKLAS